MHKSNRQASLDLLESRRGRMSDKGETQQPPKIDKELMNKALEDILDNIPAF